MSHSVALISALWVKSGNRGNLICLKVKNHFALIFQQKIVISKWLSKNCDILLFDDPTRVIDVAAKYQIWNLIIEFSNNGGSVIVASNEIPELINGCDRIITMNKGKITKTFSKNDFNEEKISLNISSNIN